MEEMSQEKLVAELAREVVVQVAPQELPLFRATSQAYFQDPDKLLKGQETRDEMLGFGTGEVVTLLTPIILPILAEVVKYLANEFASTAKTEGASYINEMVKQSFKKFRRQPGTGPVGDAAHPAGAGTTVEAVAGPAPSQDQAIPLASSEVPTGPALTKEQLNQVYEIALKKAKELKLSDSKAALLADSVIGGLALS